MIPKPFWDNWKMVQQEKNMTFLWKTDFCENLESNVLIKASYLSPFPTGIIWLKEDLLVILLCKLLGFISVSMMPWSDSSSANPKSGSICRPFKLSELSAVITLHWWLSSLLNNDLLGEVLNFFLLELTVFSSTLLRLCCTVSVNIFEFSPLCFVCLSWCDPILDLSDNFCGTSLLTENGNCRFKLGMVFPKELSKGGVSSVSDARSVSVQLASFKVSSYTHPTPLLDSTNSLSKNTTIEDMLSARARFFCHNDNELLIKL